MEEGEEFIMDGEGGQQHDGDEMEEDNSDSQEEIEVPNGIVRPLTPSLDSVITPSLPLREMIFVPPVMIHK